MTQLITILILCHYVAQPYYFPYYLLLSVSLPAVPFAD